MKANDSWVIVTSSISVFIWIFYGIFLFVQSKRESGATKRAKAGRRSFVSGALFVAIVFVCSKFQLTAIWIAIPVGGILWYNYLNTYICSFCNKTFNNVNSFGEVFENCPYCGKPYRGNFFE